jgi:hypothetical protein
MKKLVWLFAMLLVVPASTAFGDPGNGIDLTWDDCVGQAAALNNKDFDCPNAGAIHELIGCFKVAAGMPDFFAMDISMDVQQADNNPLVPFLRYEAGPPPGCNSDGLTINDARSQSGPNCATFATAWGVTGASPAFTGITAYGPNYQGQNGRGRLLASIARASDNPFALVGGTNYYAFHFEFAMFNSVQSAGGANCAGCGTPASIVWNSATLYGNTETRVLTGADKKSFYCATVNNGVSACAATPTRNTTWGQLKSIYR